MDKIQTILLALKISGIGMLVLLLVLAALALLVSLLTRFIKDKPEESEENSDGDEEFSETTVIKPVDDLGRIAAIAVAIARTQPKGSSLTNESTPTFNNWGQFHLNRRLNLSSHIWRSK
ncbi:MAG: OadG family transporter subunit [Anaerolineaceae bacterium]